MNFNPIPDLLLLITVVICFGFTIFSFIRATRLTRNSAYLYLSIGFVIAFFGYLLTVVTMFFSDADNKDGLVLTLIIIINISIVVAFLIIVNSLILIREDKLPIFSHIAGVLVGAALLVIVNIDLTNISYDETIQFWIVKYNMDLLLPIGIIFSVIFFIYFLLYLARKFQKFLNYKRFDHTLLSILLIGFWMALIYFENLRVIRHFIFPVAILFFGISVFFDPLNMLVSNKLPEEIILVTENNQPIVRYLVSERKIEKNLDEIKLFIAGKRIISESLNSNKKSKELILEGKEIKIVDFKRFHIIAIGNKVDRNSAAAIYLSFCKIKKTTDLDYLHSTSVINEQDEKLFIETFTENLKRIDATKRKKSRNKK